MDIEHVDHIVDMRRYQVMIESEFPTELGGLFRNLENKGNPWGQNNRDRMDWAKDLPFEVPVVNDTIDRDHEYLFWVGCAGAFDDRARKTTRAVAELMYMAAVGFAVLGTEETCTGDPARRAGNEFLFQMMAQATTETINTAFGERVKRKIVVTCPPRSPYSLDRVLKQCGQVTTILRCGPLAERRRSMVSTVGLRQHLEQELVPRPPGRVAGAGLPGAQHREPDRRHVHQLRDRPGGLLGPVVERPGAAHPEQVLVVGVDARR